MEEIESTVKNITTAAVGAAASFMLPIVVCSGVAVADDYAGLTYAKASEAAGKASQKVIIASRVGDTQQQGDCIVSRSQAAPFAGASGVHVTGTVLFYLDCDAGYATATKPGPSQGSTEGRAAKAAADQAAAEQAAKDQAAADGS